MSIKNLEQKQQNFYFYNRESLTYIEYSPTYLTYLTLDSFGITQKDNVCRISVIQFIGTFQERFIFEGKTKEKKGRIDEFNTNYNNHWNLIYHSHQFQRMIFPGRISVVMSEKSLRPVKNG